MKSLVIEKTRNLLCNSWIGLLIPAGVHQLLNVSEKTTVPERMPSSLRAHPAESRQLRSPGSKARP